MFQNAVFGDNATLNIGNDNIINIKNNIITNDFHSLKSELKKHGVSNSDIETLQNSIRADGSLSVERKEYGPRVKAWLSEIINKVSVATAVPVIINALNKFFGF